MDPHKLVRAKKLYFDAVDGDTESVRKSQQLFRTLGDDPIVLAYTGSLRLLESSRTLAVWRKGRLAKEGLEMLDRAVYCRSGNLELRFLRAASTFHLPGFFKRYEQSEADFENISTEVTAAAQSGTLDRRIAAAALFFHGIILDRRSDRNGAEAAWRAASKVGPETRAGIDALRKLHGCGHLSCVSP